MCSAQLCRSVRPSSNIHADTQTHQCCCWRSCRPLAIVRLLVGAIILEYGVRPWPIFLRAHFFAWPIGLIFLSSTCLTSPTWRFPTAWIHGFRRITVEPLKKLRDVQIPLNPIPRVFLLSPDFSWRPLYFQHPKCNHVKNVSGHFFRIMRKFRKNFRIRGGRLSLMKIMFNFPFTPRFVAIIFPVFQKTPNFRFRLWVKAFMTFDLELIIFQSRFNQPQKSGVFETPLFITLHCVVSVRRKAQRRTIGETYFFGSRVMWHPWRPTGSGGLLTRLDGHAHFFLLQFCFFRYWIFIFKLLSLLCIFFWWIKQNVCRINSLKKFSDKDGGSRLR